MLTSGNISDETRVSVPMSDYLFVYKSTSILHTNISTQRTTFAWHSSLMFDIYTQVYFRYTLPADVGLPRDEINSWNTTSTTYDDW